VVDDTNEETTMKKIEAWGSKDDMFDSCEWMVWKNRGYDWDFEDSIGHDLANFLNSSQGQLIEYCDTSEVVYFRVKS
jgi:hypothetical protein